MDITVILKNFSVELSNKCHSCTRKIFRVIKWISFQRREKKYFIRLYIASSAFVPLAFWTHWLTFTFQVIHFMFHFLLIFILVLAFSSLRSFFKFTYVVNIALTNAYFVAAVVVAHDVNGFWLHFRVIHALNLVLHWTYKHLHVIKFCPFNRLKCDCNAYTSEHLCVWVFSVPYFEYHLKPWTLLILKTMAHFFPYIPLHLLIKVFFCWS